MANIDFIRAAAIAPVLKIGNTRFNGERIVELAKEADQKDAGIIVFPRLCITGNTSGDLLRQEFLYSEQLKELNSICKNTADIKSLIVLGVFLRIENTFNSCTAILQKGELIGIAAPDFSDRTFPLLGKSIPFGNLLFHDRTSGLTVSAGGSPFDCSDAHILCRPAADEQIVGEASYRRYRVLMESRINNCGIVHASAGPHESTTSSVYSGHRIISECGSLISEGSVLPFEDSLTFGDFDPAKIRYRKSEKGNQLREQARIISIETLPKVKDIRSICRYYSKTPFVPEDLNKAFENCKEVFEIQSAALAKRIEHTRSKKIILGISGGLDSTLALLVTAKALNILGRPSKDIVGITMPGFGTTKKTYDNAISLMKLLDTEIREIPIAESVLIHFRNIGHDKNILNAVYENAQARERTQILMDIANKEGGIQIGTGDLSERALGWCTFNGDHMGMYNINANVPKTLISAIISWLANEILIKNETLVSSDAQLLSQTLQDILATPISPELFPLDEKGDLIQKTEDTVGPYILHDFFLYHIIRNGTPPRKLLCIAKNVFRDDYEETFIKKCLKEFYRRFFSQQFKRNCSPDSPKVGSVSLSPVKGWQMPSDMDAEIWLDEL